MDFRSNYNKHLLFVDILNNTIKARNPNVKEHIGIIFPTDVFEKQETIRKFVVFDKYVDVEKNDLGLFCLTKEDFSRKQPILKIGFHGGLFY